LGRICPEKGLHVLAEAFCLLAGYALMPPLFLRAAGYMASADRGYLADIKKLMAKRGLGDQFEYVGEVDRAGKNEFLQSLDIFSMPTVYRESKGVPVLEAWANAVPVVLPRHGAFEEMVADTGGGLVCEPNNPASLAEALAIFIRDPRRAAETGKTGQRAVAERYSTEMMARRYVEFFRDAIAAFPHRRPTTPDDGGATLP
jgi:glycosyltransferase involved in cell wall biosynthesis